jgi:hypothetical protein
MGRHGGSNKKPDNRPPAKSAEDLCREHGHRKKHQRYSYPRDGKWWLGYKCERCGEEGEDETTAP